jgi:molybdenum cofactor cytidylyltransferase
LTLPSSASKGKGPRPKTNKMPHNPSSVVALLLAAGQSRRMGAFKPLLPFGKTTVIESCIKYLTTGGVDSVVVVVGHRADDIRKQLSKYSVTFAGNPDPTSEMAASIAAGVREVQASVGAVLISLVDYPAIPPAVIAKILSEWSKGYRLVKPTWQGRGGHPVLVDLSFRPDLLELEPAAGLKGLFERHEDEVRRIEVDSPYIARDLDTWDDYQRLHSEIFGVSAPPASSGPHSN